MLPAHWRGPFPHPAIIAVFICLALAAPAAASPTTGVHIVKLAADGVTVLNETTVDYRWMETNLPVLGDGVTHYYHQGPIFTGDPWNPGEDANVLEKDMGAVKGTDLADLCDLVGGMAEEDTVKIRAVDGMSKVFPYRNVYEPEPRQGPMVITWYRADEGHVPDYYTGMRLVFFADTSTNPDGIHAFGVWDMHECFDREYWYFFQPNLPTTTGLSVQYVSEIIIYSNEEPTGSIHVTSTPVGAAVFIDDEETGGVTPCTLSGIETGSYAVRVEKEGFVQPDEQWVTVVANTVTEVDFNLTAEAGSIDVSSVPTNACIFLDGNATGLFTDATLENVSVGEHTVELVLPGYRNATRTVIVEKDECTLLDIVLSSTESGDANATDDEPESPHPRFAVIGPFEFRGNLEIFPANVSTIPNGTAMNYHVAGVAWGRWYLYTANTTAGTPEFTDFAPEQRYTDGVAETCAANATFGNETIVIHRPPGVPEESHLLVAIADENASTVTCWIGEGVLAPGSPHRVTFEGTFDPALTAAARLIIVGGENVSATFNGEAIAPLLRDRPAGDPAVVEYDVLPHLNASTNDICLETDREAIRNVILTVTAGNETGEEAPASVALNPLEAFVAGILDFLNGFFPFFGSSGEAPGERETDITPATPAVPAQKETPASPTATPTAGGDTDEGGRSGGLYIESYPPGMTIVVDNKKVVSQTPRVVYGLREGLHSVGVEKGEPGRNGEETGYRFGTVQAWVYPDAVAPVYLDGVTATSRKTIRVESEAYAGERFTVNGLFPAGTIPGDAVIEGMKSWFTVSRNGEFLSFAVPVGIEANKTYTIKPWNGETVTVRVGSDPAGAQVFVDGFPTGKRTPCRVGGLSPGQHRILVSMPGYLPAQEVITIPEGSSGTGGAITCTLREYIHGDLLVESTVPDAKIYLYGRYTGEKTPHTFTGMSIGTYEVRAVSENDSATVEDVLVKPGEMTACMVVLKEDVS
jgi:hypothetical protein